MVQTIERDAVSKTSEAAVHPLEPLSKAEVEAAVAIVKADPRVTPTSRFVGLMLNEPAKDLVLGYTPESHVEREAMVILLDNALGECSELVVSLTQQAVTTWRRLEGANRRSCLMNSSSAKRLSSGRPSSSKPCENAASTM